MKFMNDHGQVERRRLPVRFLSANAVRGGAACPFTPTLL